MRWGYCDHSLGADEGCGGLRKDALPPVSAQQGHPVSVRQIPTQHRFGRKCDQQHGDERDCASSSPPVSAASQPALWCQHSGYYPTCGNLLLSFVVLIASVRGNLSGPVGSRKLRVTRQCCGAAVRLFHAAAVSLWLSHCIAAPAPNPVPIRLWGALTMLVLADLAFTASGCQYLSFVNDTHWLAPEKCRIAGRPALPPASLCCW